MKTVTRSIFIIIIAQSDLIDEILKTGVEINILI